MTREQKLEQALREVRSHFDVELDDDGRTAAIGYDSKALQKVVRVLDAALSHEGEARACSDASPLTVDSLARKIRSVDGENSLGAGLLAEALMPFIMSTLSTPKVEAVKPVAEAGAMPGTDGFTMACFRAEDVPIGTPLYTSPVPTITDEAVTVKPLVWEPWENQRHGYNNRLIAARAKTAFNAYFLEHDDERGRWWVTDRIMGPEIAGPFGDEQEARAAAQAIHDRRIMSALAEQWKTHLQTNKAGHLYTSPGPAITDEAVQRAKRAITALRKPDASLFRRIGGYAVVLGGPPAGKAF